MGEGEFTRDIPFRRVCVPCRRVLSGRSASQYSYRQRGGLGLGVSPTKCPECGGNLVSIGHQVKVPRRRDVNGWKRMVAGWKNPEQWTAAISGWTR